VIDDTRDADAKVPGEFRAVQWTRLSGGEGPAVEKFCARVSKLLGGDAGGPIADRTAGSEGAAPSDGAHGRGRATPLSKPVRAWLIPATLGIAAVVALALWRPWQRPADAVAPSKTRDSLAGASELRSTEAGKLVAKAAAILDAGDEMDREMYVLAEELLKRAEALDVADAAAWSLHSLLSSDLARFGLDRSEARMAMIQTQASRALALAPGSLDAQLAGIRARLQARQGGPSIVRQLEELLAKFPDDIRIPRALAQASSQVPGSDRGFSVLEQALRRWPDDPRLQGDIINNYLLDGRFSEADAFIARSSPNRVGVRTLASELFVKLWWRGDPAAAAASVAKWPAWFLAADRGAGLAAMAALINREPEKVLDYARKVPRDYLRDSFYTGPRAVWLAWAHEQAGRSVAAQAEWRSVVQVADRELSLVPDDPAALHWKAWALARLGDTAGAKGLLRLLSEREASAEGLLQVSGNLVGLAILVGEQEEAFAQLARLSKLDPFRTRPATRALFELNSVFDPIRSDPRFQRLIAAAPSPRMAQATSVPAAPDEKSVAVLAFANLSDDKSNEYFSDGISEELLNVVAKIPGLKVSARTSAFSFKGKNVPIPEIAQQLGVAYVVEGSVRKAGDKVRITAQLIKAADGFHVWSDTFTRELKDVFAVQDEIAGLIAKNISPKLTHSAPAATGRPVDPEAFQLYLQGRALATKAGLGDLRQAIALFERAAQRDPGFHPARVQAARAYTQLGRWGGMVPQEAWTAARAALAPALAADPDSPEVLVAQGWLLRTADWKWREAEQAFARALAQRPSDPDVLVSAAVLKTGIGRSEEGQALARRALELDPLNPATQFDLGLIYRFSDRLPEAERQFRRAIELSPSGQRYRTFLALVVVALGRFEEAEALARNETDELSRHFVLGLAAAGRGDRARLREIITQLEAKGATLGKLGDYYAYLAGLRGEAGDLDGGMAALDAARAAHDPSIGWIKVNYVTRSLHRHPRWNDFLRSVGLADDQLK